MSFQAAPVFPGFFPAAPVFPGSYPAATTLPSFLPTTTTVPVSLPGMPIMPTFSAVYAIPSFSSATEFSSSLEEAMDSEVPPEQRPSPSRIQNIVDRLRSDAYDSPEDREKDVGGHMPPAFLPCLIKL